MIENSSVLFYRNSQILDEDNVLSEMQKSPVIKLPDETAGASRLQGSPELTEGAAVEAPVRNLRGAFLTRSVLPK